MQHSVATLISVNFLLTVAAAEIQPAPGSPADEAFAALEIFFTGTATTVALRLQRPRDRGFLDQDIIN